MTDHDEPYEMAMPFVPVTSRGGPYDDAAFVAGWQMGTLDACLESARPSLWEGPIDVACREQADLMAMKHGYRSECGEPEDGWAYLRLTATGEEEPGPSARELLETIGRDVFDDWGRMRAVPKLMDALRAALDECDREDSESIGLIGTDKIRVAISDALEGEQPAE